MKLVSILFLVLPFIAHSQTGQNQTYLYSGIGFQITNHDVDPITVEKHNLSPVFGILKTDKNRNLNDFQIYNISYEKENVLIIPPNGVLTRIVEGYTSSTITLHTSYHKTLLLNKESDSDFIFGIGLGAILFFDRQSIIPKASTSFPTRAIKIGIANSIKPVVNYAISEKISLGLSSNIIIGETSYGTTTVRNPALVAAEQQQSEFTTQFFKYRDINFQLLVGVNIN